MKPKLYNDRVKVRLGNPMRSHPFADFIGMN